MQRQPVSSSNVASVGWAPIEEGEDIGTLEVEFHYGHVYQYAEVPQSVYRDAISASSVGRFMNQSVIGQYDETRVA